MKSNLTFVLTIFAIMFLASFSISAYMAILGIKGWSWFLMVSAIIIAALNYKESSDDEKEK